MVNNLADRLLTNIGLPLLSDGSIFFAFYGINSHGLHSPSDNVSHLKPFSNKFTLKFYICKSSRTASVFKRINFSGLALASNNTHQILAPQLFLFSKN